MKSRVQSLAARVVFILCGLLALSSCGTKQFDKIPHTQFISHYDYNQNKVKPFLSLWVDKKEMQKERKRIDIDKLPYSLYIKPVTLHYLVKTEDTEQYAKDIAKLQAYFDTSLAKAFQKREKKLPSFKLVNQPSKQSFTLEIAITSVRATPTKGNVVGQALGAVKSVAGLVVKPLKKSGNITMAAKLLSPKGKKLAEIADYQEDQSTIYGIDLKDFGHFSHHKTAIDLWSRELSETLTSPADKKIKGAPLFSIVPF